MKKAILLMVFSSPCLLFSQIGIKAGVNFANVTKASSINASSRTGFHAGIFLAPPTKSIISSRTELLFSRQGYNFKTNNNTGNVNLDYIMIPQFMAINITKFVQLQLGAQMAFLINAKVDSNKTSTGNASADKIMDFYNRFDYGLGGGVEVHPVSGLIAGARINISLGKLYKEPQPGQQPSFIPDINAKNNLFQIYGGWVFGGKMKKTQ